MWRRISTNHVTINRSKKLKWFDIACQFVTNFPNYFKIWFRNSLLVTKKHRLICNSLKCHSWWVSSGVHKYFVDHSTGTQRRHQKCNFRCLVLLSPVQKEGCNKKMRFQKVEPEQKNWSTKKVFQQKGMTSNPKCLVKLFWSFLFLQSVFTNAPNFCMFVMIKWITICTRPICHLQRFILLREVTFIWNSVTVLQAIQLTTTSLK